MTGIYLITNMVNGKIYVGQAVDIEKRWGYHKAKLNGGYHSNKHLQRAWNKYGADSFSFTVLTECAEEQLNTMEEYFIFCLDSYDSRVGYNKNYGGGSGRPTEETKRKLSENNAMKRPEVRKKVSESSKIAQNRPEVKRKMSESMKGKNNPMYGKTHSAETKNRISESHKGKTHSAETKRKISETMKGNKNNLGKTFSAETKKRMSESAKNRKDNKTPVIGIHKVTGLIVEYPSTMEAGRITGIYNGSIVKCCKGALKSAGGYTWMYAEE